MGLKPTTPGLGGRADRDGTRRQTATIALNRAGLRVLQDPGRCVAA